MNATAEERAYNVNLDPADQVEAEESISATIFDRLDYIEEGERFSRAACNRLAFDILAEILGRFPTGYAVHEDDFKRHVNEIEATIFKRQPGQVDGRVFSEEDCNRLGR